MSNNANPIFNSRHRLQMLAPLLAMAYEFLADLTKARPYFLASLLCCLLTQCTLSYHDPGSAQLRAEVETNLPKSSIVGMWHRRFNVEDNVTQLWSFLFRPDGTGVHRFVLKDTNAIILFNVSTEKQYDFNWTYEGGGVWKAQGNSKINLASCNGYSFMISGNRLLSNRPAGASEFIYKRVE